NYGPAVVHVNASDYGRAPSAASEYVAERSHQVGVRNLSAADGTLGPGISEGFTSRGGRIQVRLDSWMIIAPGDATRAPPGALTDAAIAAPAQIARSLRART